jgi:plasmid maintenance system antidote protein VapI
MARSRVTDPVETFRTTLGDHGWSPAELGWVLGCSTEAAESLVREPHLTPALALRLEAALEILAMGLDGVAPHDLWVLSERMETELALIRHRRHLLNQHRHEGGWSSWT